VGVGNDGSTIGDIRRAAAKLGLSLEAEELTITELHKITPPCILWWDHVHFVAYEGSLGKHEVINDPAMGRRRLDNADFKSSWTGVAIYPTDHTGIIHTKSESIVSTNEIINFMYGKSYGAVAVGLLFNIVGIVPTIILSQLTAYFTDQVLILNQLTIAKSLLWTFLALTGASALLSAAAYYLTNRANLITGVSKSLSMYKFILKLPMAWHESRTTGELANRLSLPMIIVGILTYSIVSSVGTVLQSAIILAFIFAINVQLASLFLMVYLIVLSVILYINNISKDSNQALSVENGKQQSTALGTLSELEKIRSIGEENNQFSNWAGYYTNFINFQQTLSVNQSYASLASFSASYLFTTILIIAGPILIINGDISIGDFIGLQFLVGYLNAGIFVLPALLTQYQSISSPTTRIRDAFESASPSNPYIGKAQIDQVANMPKEHLIAINKDTQLKLTSINFNYREGVKVLNDINLSLDMSKTVCLKAKPGSGITTLLRLMTGLYEQNSGNIRKVKDTMESPIELGDIRYIPTEPNLLDLDFASNINLLDGNYSINDITDAAKLSGIFETIKKYPKGLYTNVPGHGSGLSNTLLNQLIMARVLINKIQYTVIDSFVDNLEELEARNFIDNLKRREIGCLVVCNNEQYQKFFDQIVTFDNQTQSPN
jgi:ABC-type bacteriocin/lantibiotic exporter with double-glycine peptidase domain